MFLHHLCSDCLQSMLFLSCVTQNWPIPPVPCLVVSFTFPKGRLGSTLGVRDDRAAGCHLGRPSKKKLPFLALHASFLAPLPPYCQCVWFPPAFVQGQAEHHLLGSLFPFGSQSRPSPRGTKSFLCMPPAQWDDQNGDSNCLLCEELAREPVLCHCLF